MAQQTLNFTIKADTGNFSIGIDKVTGGLTNLGRKSKEVQTSTEAFMASIEKNAMVIGASITAMGASITGALGFSVKAFADAEKASLKLDAALQSTGGAIGITRAELDKMATAFS
jgi:hypothetical protein